MTGQSAAPVPVAVPEDYFARLYEVEERHWWHRGMRAISLALLGERLTRGRGAVLDAGCGTGGFLRWLADHDRFERLCGTDLSAEAIEYARRRVPAAQLTVAPLSELPFADSSFDLVATNDVLQHVLEPDVGPSLRELRRVLSPTGALLLRTNGARRLRRERPDWRAYDRASLVAALEEAALRPERATYANVAGSALDVVRGRRPRAPTSQTHGIPPLPPRAVGAAMLQVLLIEARYLSRPGRELRFGHSLLAVATPA